MFVCVTTKQKKIPLIIRQEAATPAKCKEDASPHNPLKLQFLRIKSVTKNVYGTDSLICALQIHAMAAFLSFSTVILKCLRN